MSLPLLHLLAVSAPVVEVDAEGGWSDIGGMTVRRKGDDRVGCLDDAADDDLGGDELLDKGGVGNEGTSIPKDWAIRPN
jgi:hypothetical protein